MNHNDSESLLGLSRNDSDLSDPGIDSTWVSNDGVYLTPSVLEAISSASTTDATTPLVGLLGDKSEGLKERLSRHSFSSYTGQVANNSAALTTFLLLNTMIGSGILNQPYVFRESGIFGGTVSFLIASWATWIGLMILTEVGIHANVLEYSGLAKKAFAKNGERAIDVSIVITSFGSILGYILVVGSTTASLLTSWGCGEDVCTIFNSTVVVVAGLVMPICLYRHFGHLAFLSIFSILAIVCVLFLVVIGGPLQHQASSGGSIIWFNLEGTLASTGSIVFSLSCANANFQAFISTEKSSRNFQSWFRITSVAVFMGALMCAGMGIAGYLSFRDATQGEILDNFFGHAYDFFKVMVVCHLILYIPVSFVIMRYSFVKLLWGVRSETLPLATHTALSVGLMVVTTAFVLMMLALGLSSGPAFALILNVTGGLGGSISTFIMPSAIYLKLMPRQTSKLRPAAYGLMAVGVAVLVAVLTVEISNLSKRR